MYRECLSEVLLKRQVVPYILGSQRAWSTGKEYLSKFFSNGMENTEECGASASVAFKIIEQTKSMKWN
jgi:ligand-binding sensor protein